MVWARIDDAILDNPKIVRAGVFGFAMHVAAITWCCRNLSDGRIPYGRVTALLTLDRVLVDTSNPLALADGPSSMGGDDGLDPYIVADHLVDCGLWVRTRDGYEIHDFLKYNPSRAEVEASRTKAAGRQANKRKRDRSSQESPAESRGESRRDDGVSSPHPDPDPLSDLPSSSPESSDPEIQSGSPVSTEPVEAPSEARLVAVPRIDNATADRAGGLAVSGWARGVGRGCGRPFRAPRAGAELTKLVDALLAHFPDDATRSTDAERAGETYGVEAESAGATINTHNFVDWLNSGRRLGRRGPAKPASQPTPPGGRFWSPAKAVNAESEEPEDR